MGKLSLLPDQLSFVETWLARTFLVLAALILGPWILALVYDLLLYCWRSATYELPYVGGRARGRQRPRAPSLKERPDGHRRRISLPGVTRHQSDHAVTHSKSRSTSSLPQTTHERVDEE